MGAFVSLHREMNTAGGWRFKRTLWGNLTLGCEIFNGNCCDPAVAISSY